MNQKDPLYFWNRRSQKQEEEIIYGDEGMRFLYSSKVGKKLSTVVTAPLVSRFYGAFQSSPLSRSAIAPFIKSFGIDMNEFETGPFHSFNDFFVRKFKEGRRTFASEKKIMPAFAEGRYLAFDNISSNQVFPVKGEFLSAGALLGSRSWAQKFEGGPLFIARLCPVDYHRFHFPDGGRVVDQYPIAGALHSVNPLALRFKQDIFVTNERHVSILETENFGLLAYVEVGALFVGKIVQTHDTKATFKRGDEKGYFLFGASTVIVAGQKGQWRPDDDLLQVSARGLETFVPLGEHIAFSGLASGKPPKSP